MSPTSQTETYVALKFFIDSWRWVGVPFYLRSAKRMPKRVTEIAIHFKEAPHLLFGQRGGEGVRPNVLSIRIQPDEGISLNFGSKLPGQAMEVAPVSMEFRYGSSFGVEPPEAYERLILDCLLGDGTLFTRADEVEASWTWISQIHQHWHAKARAGRGGRGRAAADLRRRAAGAPRRATAHRRRRARTGGGPERGIGVRLSSSSRAARRSPSRSTASRRSWRRCGRRRAAARTAASAADRARRAVEPGRSRRAASIHCRGSSALVDELAPAMPARVITLCRGRGTRWPASRRPSRATSCRAPAARRLVYAEEITLTGEGAAADERHFGALVRALQIPSLPTATLWFDASPADSLLSNELLPVSDRLVIDTGRCARRARAPAALCRTGARINRVEIADLGWLRLASFRLLFAGLFDPPVGGGPLAAASHVEIEHRGPKLASALLLAAWLGVQLGWRAARRHARRRQGDRHPPALRRRPRAATARAHGGRRSAAVAGRVRHQRHRVAGARRGRPGRDLPRAPDSRQPRGADRADRAAAHGEAGLAHATPSCAWARWGPAGRDPLLRRVLPLRRAAGRSRSPRAAQAKVRPPRCWSPPRSSSSTTPQAMARAWRGRRVRRLGGDGAIGARHAGASRSPAATRRARSTSELAESSAAADRIDWARTRRSSSATSAACRPITPTRTTAWCARRCCSRIVIPAAERAPHAGRGRRPGCGGRALRRRARRRAAGSRDPGHGRRRPHRLAVPGHDRARPSAQRRCVAVHVPKLSTSRLTLTYPVFEAAREVFFLIAGEDKADDAQGRRSRAPTEPDRFPCQAIFRRKGPVAIFCDRGAAAELSTISRPSS